jgi:hypothetical protein
VIGDEPSRMSGHDRAARLVARLRGRSTGDGFLPKRSELEALFGEAPRSVVR